MPLRDQVKSVVRLAVCRVDLLRLVKLFVHSAACAFACVYKSEDFRAARKLEPYTVPV